mmetsp:Transcript_30917/g.78815  ORF Transcript_30917/g.78815 Transcript_30917/m.78815 type:complete len:349 (-) Transcript_30917:309-1355(-)
MTHLDLDIADRSAMMLAVQLQLLVPIRRFELLCVVPPRDVAGVDGLHHPRRVQQVPQLEGPGVRGEAHPLGQRVPAVVLALRRAGERVDEPHGCLRALAQHRGEVLHQLLGPLVRADQRTVGLAGLIGPLVPVELLAVGALRDLLRQPRRGPRLLLLHAVEELRDAEGLVRHEDPERRGGLRRDLRELVLREVAALNAELQGHHRDVVVGSLGPSLDLVQKLRVQKLHVLPDVLDEQHLPGLERQVKGRSPIRVLGHLGAFLNEEVDHLWDSAAALAEDRGVQHVVVVLAGPGNHGVHPRPAIQQQLHQSSAAAAGRDVDRLSTALLGLPAEGRLVVKPRRDLRRILV